LEDAGAVAAGLAVFEAVLDGVVVGEDEDEDEDEEAAVEEGCVVLSGVPGVVSFLSPLAAIGRSLSEEGFILSE
jgi:hypothetical protein